MFEWCRDDSRYGISLHDCWKRWIRCPFLIYLFYQFSPFVTSYCWARAPHSMGEYQGDQIIAYGLQFTPIHIYTIYTSTNLSEDRTPTNLIVIFAINRINYQKLLLRYLVNETQIIIHFIKQTVLTGVTSHDFTYI